MRYEIVPFGREHLEGSAQLLAQRHAADRAREPGLPAQFAHAGSACCLLTRALSEDDAQGVVAVSQGRVLGYLLGKRLLPSPTSVEASIARPRSAIVGYAGHAADPEHAYEVYRKLYAALSPSWLASGLFAHYVFVPALDSCTLDAWASLGFGRDLVRAVRSTEPAPASAHDPAIEIRQAEAADLDEVLRLQMALYKHHASPPIYAPYLPEAFRDQRANTEAMLVDPTSAVWLAFRGARAVAMQALKPAASPQPGCPDHCAYLTEGYTDPNERGTGVGAAVLARSLEWARDNGYDWCVLNFLPPNLLAARFWTHNGFRPLSYRLLRTIDERIAWASGV
jgi:GNAT superfamily N-acetyltransferase